MALTGLVLIAYAIPVGFAPGPWNWLGWIGVVPIATALFGVCPLYSLVGLSTCPRKSAGSRRAGLSEQPACERSKDTTNDQTFDSA